ncbi:MAG: 1-acyl-sn-glycerol-3-phosphate acyltransferase [Odoribacteraceae bacterium]|jgi:1-acyl-sn-glycerol-3-phosphate acyltransferase|nr:1-acyl-sn-glycerol-3-phosphate acyltransferase [Odoribacteraceae bacterium]
MTRLFVSIHAYLLSHRKCLYLSLLLVTAGALLALSRLEYKEDIADFLPSNAANDRVNAVYRHVGNSNHIIIYFSATDSTGDPAVITTAIDRFALLLEERDSLHSIPKVTARVDEERVFELLDFVRHNPPYFLVEADYGRVDSLLRSSTLVADRVEEDKRLLMLPSGGIMRQEIQADPLHLFSPVLSRLKELQAGEDENARDGYLFTPDGRKGMVILESPHGVSETARNTALLAWIEEIAREVTRELPGITASYLGAPVIAVTNAGQIKRDSTLAIALSGCLILLLLFYSFRSARDLCLIFCSILFGWLIALALLALFKGSISVIAVGIGSIFIGIAINYPLHLIDRLKHQPDTRQALKEIAHPLLIGNITTVSAFLSLLFISSDAMRDLGIFGSLLLVGTILFVLVYLPHLAGARRGGSGQEHLPFGRLASFAPEKRRWIVWPVLLLTILFLHESRFTTFEPDMNQINYMTAQQREDMQLLTRSLERRDQDIVYLVSGGEGLDGALASRERNVGLLDSLRRVGLIKGISGVGPFLPSRAEQQRRIDRWNAFWLPRRERLARQIEEAARANGFKEGTFDPFLRLLHAPFAPREAAYFAPVTSLVAGNYVARDGDKEMVITLLYCEKERTAALAGALRAALTGDTFFFDSRDIGRRMVDALSGDFNRVLYLCGIIVFLFLTFSFGRVELGVISFLPLAVGWIWILGIMQLADIRFNIVNIILATFIFGQGDDYTIFITEGLIHEHAYRRRLLASYKNGIILSALVMFIGIGTLVLARHPALRSLAEITIIGMFSVVLMAYLIPPLLFRWLTTRGGERRAVPVTLSRLLYSCHALLAFLMGLFVITAAGFVLFTAGKKTERRRALYHALLCRVARFVIRHVPGTRFRFENLSGETFEKPAVIISNHQSHLDLMCLIMLTPRLVILTNDWVWKSPWLGRLVKYADFYPVSGGIEAGVEALADRVRAGYSIVVFPEGTRSADCSIRRFHRGAFYLAERLRLDILPVLIHGAGDVLPKTDFMLRRGTISVQVHPRFPAGTPGGEGDHVAWTKQARRYYLRAFAALSRERETAAYFRSFVLHNYLYKGASIERAVRRMLAPGSALFRQVDAYRGDGPVLVKNNGNGLFALLFALVHEHLRVFAVEADEEMLALASGCALPANLTVCREEELPPGTRFETTYTLANGWINA